MRTHGKTVSPDTGTEVLAFRKEFEGQLVRRDLGDKLETVALEGEIGDAFNYVTLENYGNRVLSPIRIITKTIGGDLDLTESVE